MKLFPAIDLLGGKVVRLTQGDYERLTVYENDPCAQAQKFLAAGAKYLHVVDLDGAREGNLANFASIRALARLGGLYLEVGGGIRDEARICQYLELGVSRCILGTVAVRDFTFTRHMIKKYKDRIAVGVDARDGKVAVSGWEETSALDGIAFCKRLQEAGCQAVIYTDISRDGALQGTNLPLYRRLAQEVPELQITASGGITKLEELKALEDNGTAAAILGKSLYTGAIDLKKALEAVQE
ncbi:MAG: 1-(5-phosphoribosyl)-5-[(5-phosphoribosylamino)methylideneamino]imidazole-4-carboxamide isomerase [Faecalibacterium sp.]|jgi:phosphoribosylformimino-5-aminoimidazole carboxamide ribotide isomerase|nr:1-(5-phosphoribosyl)-5-[(5-phosphoribosylamino)methylideneamino]imidazole-4-carboxamide isomerase [Faecalibacterium sp.]